jgi:hypothetical protein
MHHKKKYKNVLQPFKDRFQKYAGKWLDYVIGVKDLRELVRRYVQ